MLKKNIFLIVSQLLSTLLLITGCQGVSVPEDIESKWISLHYDDVSNFIGEFVDFDGTIEFSYYTDCDEQIEERDSCLLFLMDSPHRINIILEGGENTIDTSGNIHFSDGTYQKPDPWGHISAHFTGKVRDCDEQKACVIDIYQIDKLEN